MVVQIVANVEQAFWDSLVAEFMAIIIKDKWRGIAAQFFSSKWCGVYWLEICGDPGT